MAPPTAPGPLAEAAGAAVTAYRDAMDAFALHGGVAAAFQLVDAANEYIAAVEPWATARDPARAAELDRQLYDVSEAVRIAAVLLAPVMPGSCREVLARVGAQGVSDLYLDRDAVWTTPPGAERQVVKGDPLWPRLDPDRAASNDEKDAQRKAAPPRAAAGRKARVAADAGAGTQRREQRTMNDSERSGGAEAAPAPASPRPEVGGSPAGEGAADAAAPGVPETPRISIDEFAKVELRVGRVVTAEAVRKSKKLVRLEVDDGGGVRQIVAGIARAYEPETLVGRHVVFVANLQPAKLMGIESNGMVLAALDAEGQPVLLTPDDSERAPAGSAIR